MVCNVFNVCNVCNVCYVCNGADLQVGVVVAQRGDRLIGRDETAKRLARLHPVGTLHTSYTLHMLHTLRLQDWLDCILPEPGVRGRWLAGGTAIGGSKRGVARRNNSSESGGGCDRPTHHPPTQTSTYPPTHYPLRAPLPLAPPTKLPRVYERKSQFFCGYIRYIRYKRLYERKSQFFCGEMWVPKRCTRQPRWRKALANCRTGCKLKSVFSRTIDLSACAAGRSTGVWPVVWCESPTW